VTVTISESLTEWLKQEQLNIEFRLRQKATTGSGPISPKGFFQKNSAKLRTFGDMEKSFSIL
jgi:hypothetical protein